jgi:chromosome partitioning protein
MNTKGGCGKTTVATNLASLSASLGRPTALLDYDPQASSSRWLRSRPPDLPAPHGVAAYAPPAPGTTRAFQMRLPPETRLVVMDTPAGFAGVDLEDRIAGTDVILVPVLPSAIDIPATADFIRDLLIKGKVRSRNKRLAIVANRLRANTRSLARLERFLAALDIPVIARLRDTQRYIRAAEQGLGVHELRERGIDTDRAPWAAMLSWLGGG